MRDVDIIDLRVEDVVDDVKPARSPVVDLTEEMVVHWGVSQVGEELAFASPQGVALALLLLAGLDASGADGRGRRGRVRPRGQYNGGERIVLGSVSNV